MINEGVLAPSLTKDVSKKKDNVKGYTVAAVDSSRRKNYERSKRKIYLVHRELTNQRNSKRGCTNKFIKTWSPQVREFLQWNYGNGNHSAINNNTNKQIIYYFSRIHNASNVKFKEQ